MAFYSPTGSARSLQPAPEPPRYVGPATNAAQAPAAGQQQQQAAAPPPPPPRQAAPPTQQQAVQQQQSKPAAVRVEMVILPSPLRPPKRGKKVSTLSPAAPRGNAGPAEAAAAMARAVAAPRAVALVQPAAAAATGAAAPPPAAAAPAAAKRRRSSGSKRPERKTLTVRCKRAAVLGVLADVELQRAAAAPAAAAAAPGASAQQQQQQQRAPAQAPPAPQQQQQAAAQPPADPAATANLGRAWSKADVATLARLAEDRAFLLLTIPQHPPGGELDWELISRHFGR